MKKSREGKKVDLKSLDIKKDQIRKLKEVFPEAVTERKVDFDKLKQTLGEEVDTGKERYGLQWPGKSNCFKIIQQPSIGTLKPVREESVDFDNTENLFIEGENLEVLKLLQKSYYGKVKMIYIDPPYNTGNDFVYRDDYKDSLKDYLQFTGQTDGEGKAYSNNPETSGRYHSSWINMIYPRLFLANNLLSKDGVLFVSIDDNEVDNLKKISNEIFGEDNFVAEFIWKSRQNKDNRNTTGASIDHEYILSYSKNNNVRALKGSGRKIEQYSNPDNDPRGDWASGNMVGILPENLRPNCHYDLINPKTGINYGKPKMGWRYDKKTMQRLISEDRIIWPVSPTGRPRRKVFLNELSDTYTGFSSIIGENIYTKTGTQEIEELFGFRAFDFPKPSSLIKEIIDQVCEDNDIVLDFFAGSATTAHAVLDLNKEDGSRKFIMVQLPEPTQIDSEAHKAGFKTVSDIGKERIRRVINKIKEEMEGKLDFDKKQIDLGFKVFKLDKSNFRVWDGSNKGTSVEEQLKLHVDHIDPKSSQDDLFNEILLHSGFQLTVPIKKLTFDGKTLYSVDDGSMLVCLEKTITKKLVEEMVARKPIRVVCLDSGFSGNDQLKTNTLQLMKSKDIEFRTI